VEWKHRDERYAEKLATPDTSVADLIGDVDPMKVAEGRSLGDPETIHFGLIPRSHRGSSRSTSCPTSPSGSRWRCST
jgi:magnesium chelatase subunit I